MAESKRAEWNSLTEFAEKGEIKLLTEQEVKTIHQEYWAQRCKTGEIGVSKAWRDIMSLCETLIDIYENQAPGMCVPSLQVGKSKSK